MSGRKRIFISSVQKGTASERAAVRDFVHAEPLFLARYIEKAGTGTLDMFALCKQAGLPEPEFRTNHGVFVQTIRRTVATSKVKAEEPVEVTPEVTPEVTGEVQRLILSLHHGMIHADILSVLGLRGQGNFRTLYVVPAMEAGLVEMTIPDKPKSSRQKYRLSAKGRAWVAAIKLPNKKGGKE